MAIAYVTPSDLTRLYEPEELIQATNLYNAAAATINSARLQEACDNANGVAYGYLATKYPDSILQVEALPAGFRAAFRAHALNIARFYLDRSSEEVQLRRDEAIEYFKWVAESNSLGFLLTPNGSEVSDTPNSSTSKVWTAARVAGLF